MLALFGWRKRWLPESHPLVRAHRFIHSPQGLIAVALLGWASHIVIDWHTPHRLPPSNGKHWCSERFAQDLLAHFRNQNRVMANFHKALDAFGA